MSKLTELLCDRCMTVVERYAALTGPPDAFFFATAAAIGEGAMCGRCEAKVREHFGLPPLDRDR